MNPSPNNQSGNPAVPAGQSLLVVDDDNVFRERLARAMTNRGFEVRAAANHDEAVMMARQDSPELAVVDMRMPGQSGLELVRSLKEVDASTRVVVLTGYGSVATAVEAMRLGASNYIAKPADADDILAAFEHAEKPVLEPTETYKAPSLARAEWEHINRVLSDCGGNISETARRLGIHRRSLQRKLHRFAPQQ